MTQFEVKPTIQICDTCAELAQALELGPKDLILTNQYIYDPYFGPLNLSCPTIFQEKYGAGEPSDEMVTAIYNDIAKVLSRNTVTPILDLYDGKIPLEKGKELILVPTTCGTGSEVTNLSILALISLNTKKGLGAPCMFGDKAVLVPELLKTLPLSVFATSSIYALIHSIESSLSPKANPITELFGYKAIEIILKGYMEIRDKGPEARIPLLKDFLLASTYGGIAFGNAGCAAVHALSYPLGAAYHVPHGESNYAMFTGVMKKYMSIRTDGDIAKLNAYMAGILGCDVDKVYEALEDLLNTLLPKKALHEYGMKESELEEFTDSVIANQQRLLNNNFVPLSRQDILDIYTSPY